VKSLRRLLLCLVMAGCLGTAYAATPFIAMWNLREAIKRGDSAAIEDRVDWPKVRESLKASLAVQAKLLPIAEAAGGQVKPTLWQRIKGAFGAPMLDRFIETYVTPEGLPKLFDYRRTWNESIKGVEPEDAQTASRLERAQKLWARVKRAEFQSFTRLEVEMEDHKVPDRRILSVMELEGMTWKLTNLQIKSVGSAEPQQFMQAFQPGLNAPSN
jgi:Protein of unknown function (DUF2939)